MSAKQLVGTQVSPYTVIKAVYEPSAPVTVTHNVTFDDQVESTDNIVVEVVDGETADESEQQWWGYSVNGTFAELGVDSQPVADGDVYDFVLNVGW